MKNEQRILELEIVIEEFRAAGEKLTEQGEQFLRDLEIEKWELEYSNARDLLIKAAEENQIEKVKCCFFMPGTDDDLRQEVLDISARNGYLELAMFCVENGLKPFKKIQRHVGEKYSAFQIAKRWDRKNIVNYFESVYKK